METFNVMQASGANEKSYMVIKGRLSPAGYPVGTYEVIVSGLTLKDARIACDILNKGKAKDHD